MYDFSEISTLSIVGEDGKERNYYVICTFCVNELGYIALAPTNKSNDVKLYHCHVDGNNIQVSDILSDVELTEATEAYESIMRAENEELAGDDFHGMDSVIVITDADGTQRICEIVGVFEYENLDCIVLLPIDRVGIDEPTIELFQYSIKADHADKNFDKLFVSDIPEHVFPHAQEYYINHILRQ